MTKFKRDVPMLTDEDEAKLQVKIASDPDSQELTDEQLATMRPASEVLPPALYVALTRPRGRPKAEITKVAIKLRLDQSVIEHFKSAGAGWQTRMNSFLGANATVLRMIDENDELIGDMEKMIECIRAGQLRMVTEPVEKTIYTIERNIRNVKETSRCLREQLVVGTA